MGFLENLFNRSNVIITIDKNIKLSPGESLSNPSPTKKNAKPTLDEQWQSITKRSQEHLKSGKLGLYACDLYDFSEIDRKEKRYNDQIMKLMISAYIHLSGAEEFQNYQQLKSIDKKSEILYPVLPPAVIRATGVAMKRLDMELSIYKNLFKQTINPTMTPIHLYGIDGALEIICLYLTDKPDKAEKKIRSGAKKYVTAHS